MDSACLKALQCRQVNVDREYDCLSIQFQQHVIQSYIAHKCIWSKLFVCIMWLEQFYMHLQDNIIVSDLVLYFIWLSLFRTKLVLFFYLFFLFTTSFILLYSPILEHHWYKILSPFLRNITCIRYSFYHSLHRNFESLSGTSGIYVLM